jgi:hypothetical protein
MGVLDSLLEPILRTKQSLAELVSDARVKTHQAYIRQKAWTRSLIQETAGNIRGYTAALKPRLDDLYAVTLEPWMSIWHKHYHRDNPTALVTRIAIMSVLVGGNVYLYVGLRSKVRILMFWGSYSVLTAAPEVLNPYRRSSTTNLKK